MRHLEFTIMPSVIKTFWLSLLIIGRRSTMSRRAGPSTNSRPSQMATIAGAVGEMVDRAGDVVNADKWKKDADAFSSTLFKAAIEAQGKESIENNITYQSVDTQTLVMRG